MKYLIAEKFKSVQGEGVYAGTPMAFIRFTGCSVGKKICNACDTAFEKTHPWLGGGEFSLQELKDWSVPFGHLCLTGGEPFDQDLSPFFRSYYAWQMIHVETSGTRPIPDYANRFNTWICVSPKPGFLEETISEANEIKVIVPGLGVGEGWPSLEDALRWAEAKPERPVFLQPRNRQHEIDWENLHVVQELVQQYPSLKMSVQLHKLLKVR